MDWPALRRFARAIGPDGRARLLRILEAPSEERAAATGRLHLRDDGELLEELLIELEERSGRARRLLRSSRRAGSERRP